MGNPLALLELPGLWRASTSPSLGLPPSGLTDRLERAFAARIAELPPAGRDALLVAALNPTDTLVEILAAASALAGRPLGVTCLDEACAAKLVGVDGAQLHFRHPLVRSGVLHSETLTRRQAGHAALASVLTAEPYRRTWHRAGATLGPDDEVADAPAANADLALSRGAVTAAIRDLERAAQLTTESSQRGRRLLLAATQAYGLGRADLVDRFIEGAQREDLSELDRARTEWLRETNREIGQRTFLSHRTVGSHLYRIFPKLNITSRNQLAQRLAADGRTDAVRTTEPAAPSQ
jgi:DNA-binding CsgD family transcriptional regulator